jgi:hypothetical protein
MNGRNQIRWNRDVITAHHTMGIGCPINRMPWAWVLGQKNVNYTLPESFCPQLTFVLLLQ